MTENLNDSGSPNRDSNLGTSEHEAGVAVLLTVVRLCGWN